MSKVVNLELRLVNLMHEHTCHAGPDDSNFSARACWRTYSTFLKELCVIVKRQSDELLVACLMLLLAAPMSVLPAPVSDVVLTTVLSHAIACSTKNSRCYSLYIESR